VSSVWASFTIHERKRMNNPRYTELFAQLDDDTIDRLVVALERRVSQLISTAHTACTSDEREAYRDEARKDNDLANAIGKAKYRLDLDAKIAALDLDLDAIIAEAKKET